MRTVATGLGSLAVLALLGPGCASAPKPAPQAAAAAPAAAP